MAVEVRASAVMPLIRAFAGSLAKRPPMVAGTIRLFVLAEVAAVRLGWEGELSLWTQASYLILFLLGAFILLNRQHLVLIREKASWAPRLALLLALGTGSAARPGAGGVYTAWGPAALKLSAGATARCIATGSIAPRIFTSKPVSFLGAVSYSLYLCHSLIIEVIKIAAPAVFRCALGFNALCIALAILLAWALFVIVERPTTLASRKFAE